MASQWFSESERVELAIPVIKRIKTAIRKGDTARAVALCEELRKERVLLHDFFTDCLAAIFTWTGENLGEDKIPDMFTYCFENSSKRPVFDLMGIEIERGLMAELLVRGWVAHSCGGAGEHPGAFRVEEDDEKFTFIMDPCGSGGRLLRKGSYNPPLDFALTSEAYPWSFNREGFPYYCTHCSFINESMPMRYNGIPSWPLDPPARADEACRWYIYKDKRAIPERFYERYGVKKETGAAPAAASGERWFTPQQIADTVRPTYIRIQERLERGDTKGALRIIREMAGDFVFLHSQIVNMLVSIFDFISRRAGEEKLGDALFFLYEKGVRRQIATSLEGMDRREALCFIVHNFFLADLCGGGSYPPGGVSVSEDAGGVTIILDPCGSGGKLLRHNAYRPLSPVKKAMEKIEVASMRLTAKLPLPLSLQKSSIPFTLDYFCETRRPAGMGTTTRAYDWSGNRAGMPYYCCLCTSFMKEAGADWLQVHPPEGRRDPCVWRAAK
ncbi:MAG: hypothetical protein C4536_01485 [Actinobacteria bacterium]|jgi:hypothetical protein|nr:MAG: hypothetical protein C4536_01485 [Actinomycetota bacterium]